MRKGSPGVKLQFPLGLVLGFAGGTVTSAEP